MGVNGGPAGEFVLHLNPGGNCGFLYSGLGLASHTLAINLQEVDGRKMPGFTVVA